MFKKVITKADIVLFIVILVLGTAISAYAFVGGDKGEQVVIKVRGVEQGRYKLSENKSIDLKQHSHTNTVLIKDGKVKMKYSDCNNQNCVHQGEISRTNESIVCLPNRVSIEIVGGEGVDDLAK